MEITYREYAEEDKKDLIALEHELEEFQKQIDPLKRVQNLKGFAELEIENTLKDLNKNKGRIWFAMDGNTKIGCVIGIAWNKQPEKSRLEIGPHKLGEVMHLYVEKEYRGKGIGKQLLSLIENYFRKENCDSVWLDVFSPNINAHELYKKVGFVDRQIGMLKDLK